eukprot:12416643-Alexandrium_andersonii.AAC.1
MSPRGAATPSPTARCSRKDFTARRTASSESRLVKRRRAVISLWEPTNWLGRTWAPSSCVWSAVQERRAASSE